VVYVGDAGCDYTSIQSALDAVGANALVLVYPGTYTDTINFTANGQCVVGIGSTSQQIVQQADATVCDFGAYTNCVVANMKIQLTAPTTAKDAVTGSGSCNFRFCHIKCTNTTNIAALQQPSCMYTTGTVKIRFGTVEYDNSGDDGDGATAVKGAIRLGTGCVVTTDRVSFIITGSNKALGTVPAYGLATGVLSMQRSDVAVTDLTAALVVGTVYSSGTETDEMLFNEIHVTAGAANAGYGYVLAGSGTMRSMLNHVHVVDGGGSSRYAIIGAGTTFISQFDDIIAADGITNNGTLYQVNSETDGALSLSGALSVGDVTINASGSIDMNGRPFYPRWTQQSGHATPGTGEAQISEDTDTGEIKLLFNDGVATVGVVLS